MAKESKSLAEALQVIVGKGLASVTFVMDYWQLGFSGPVLTVMTRLEIAQVGRLVESATSGFRDILCDQITKTVQSVEFVDDVLIIEFENGSTIRAFARADDYRGPEAILFQPLPTRDSTELWVVN